MLKHLNILIAYFLIAVALLFRLNLEPHNLLFVAQPAIIILFYWRKLPQLKAKGLHKLTLNAFALAYGFHLFTQVYDVLKYKEQEVDNSTFLTIVFVVVIALAFVSEEQIEGDETAA